ncbi:splicing factor 3B subunit 2-like isoform X2 [Macadamia integrifolia]|uniref:splicing factor 3B subunit 2-like isoform X2 n=1 Tax=Macadamia integrifolia TaxID=60698 RepID=UPI001C5317FC|nr:splicing factor 3B subunit 2-like isoform X2 [Macadamia integrifolia]
MKKKEEPVDRSKHWGDLEEEEEEEEEEDEEQIEEEELEVGIQSVDSLSSTPTGVETPDVIDLRKQQRKEPEKPLYQVLEEKEEKIAPGTLLGTTHTYVLGSGTQEKSAAKGLICYVAKNRTKWMSLFSQKNWMFWTMLWLPSMRKRGRRRSCEASMRISATWLRRIRRRESGRCRKRKESQRRRNSSFSVFYICISHIWRSLALY